jgi:myosin heavy subunit
VTTIVDASFLDNLQRNFSSQTDVFSSEKGSPVFKVRHYAGWVPYDSRGFVEANNDKLSQEAKDLCEVSTVRVLVDAFRATSNVMIAQVYRLSSLNIIVLLFFSDCW